jgi:hypothetical protein
VSLVPSQTDSGLTVLMHGSDEAAVSRALRDFDNDLRLVPQDSDAYGQRVYKVYRYNGPERRADFLFLWGDDYGNPYPLSMAILERVKTFDKNQRGNAEFVNEDEHNRRLREARQKDYDSNVESIQQEELSRKGRIYGFHKSPALAAARRRGRRRGATYDSRKGN